MEMKMFFQFTASGRWYVRNDRGQIVSKHFDSFDDLMENFNF